MKNALKMMVSGIRGEMVLDQSEEELGSVPIYENSGWREAPTKIPFGR